LYDLATRQTLVEESAKDKKAKEQKQKKLEKEIAGLNAEIEESQSGGIYDNAVEWRFEFPEVLNNDGDFTGFDVVIGNPPYIRQEEFSAIKPYLQQRFQIYNSISDILTYFVELGYDLLKDNGIFQFIVSNKFTRANYGKQMRKFLSDKTAVTHFIDFSGLPVFDEATVDAAIVGFEKRKTDNNTLIYSKIPKTGFDINNFSGNLNLIKQDFLQSGLTEQAWAFESSEVLRIKQKAESQGTPLKDWDISINFGIKTGYNRAFVVDGKKRAELIAQDQKSAEILKPLLRGRDVHKYYSDFQDLWLINLHNGYRKDGEHIPALKAEDYPAVKKHLDQFFKELDKRTDKGKTPYNLRNCTYIEAFEKPKIIYRDISQVLTFTLDYECFYTNNTIYFITGDFDLQYLLATLNSKLFDFYYRLISTQLGSSAVRLFNQFVEQIPVKQITKKQEKPFKERASKILAAKKQDPHADTGALEKEIDRLVYELYGLTEEEIAVVEKGI